MFVTALSALLLFSQEQTPEAPAPDDGIKRNIVYSTAGTRNLMADFFPASGKDKKGLVIMIHGGAWMGGNRRDMEPLAKRMAEKGVSAVTITYRLAPSSKWPAMIDDAKAAVRYFRTNAEKYNIDPNRVGAAGGSAGGHLALLLGFMPNDAAPGTPSAKVSAVFNIFGPVDMTNDFDQALVNFIAPQVLGKPAADAKEEIRAFSPINFVTKETMVPVFTLHGDQDATVPVEQARRLDRKIKEVGGEHIMVIVAGMGHFADPNKPDVIKALDDGLEFLAKHLSPKR
ncbi:MAG: alpha/beta hydrolase [Fimbriimonadaceae bacterium]|jgi:acetyl esterase/lipase|nr:alpha/beta hydrolase [Fimbriimonadaceae bacterium]